MAINACLVPVCALHGAAVTTIEGIGSIKNGVHPIQVKDFDGESLLFVGERVTYHRPTSLDDLLDLKSKYPDAILVAGNTENEFVSGYKQSHRKEDDIAIVNAGMRVSFNVNGNSVDKLYLAFGGMSDKVAIASQTMKKCEGR
ncbi:hypothetical protein KUTeg_022240 [Tegillarca granosa]|uniref:CO dehydrogenase flavoprotein C-terminal domain-containing protein n=1 Tax=Tegillarca granosa TaxID=220873 RepID=A0ABQ9E8I5_TEGGR|nr:hypothetical protein KUTeg_022240 [Tegillarca granosa]